MKLAKHIEDGCFEKVVSVSASKHSFVAVISTPLSFKELEGRASLEGVGKAGQWR